MKSTGEVMGVGETFGEAFVKSQLAAGVKLPRSGQARSSACKNADKARVVEVSKMLVDLGFELVATRGTAAALTAAGVTVRHGQQGRGRPPAHRRHARRTTRSDFVVNTVEEKRAAIQDSYQIRRAALVDQIPTYTTIAGARAAAIGMKAMREMVPYAVQELHERLTEKKGVRDVGG